MAYEVEIKSLLGSKKAATALLKKMSHFTTKCELSASSEQLNHYFEGGDSKSFPKLLGSYLETNHQSLLKKIIKKGRDLSVRTRQKDDQVYFVIKASIGDDSSQNGIVREEIEAHIPNLTLEQLDNKLLSVGYRYQAKWSRSRKEYKVNDISVCLDKNAGYGYVVEFEKVVNRAAETKAARKEIVSLMNALKIEELPQTHLEQMFKYYNQNWGKYYGTDQIFSLNLK